MAVLLVPSSIEAKVTVTVTSVPQLPGK